MAFRTILGVTGADRGDDDIELAASLCEESGAHLLLLLLSLAPPPAVGRFGEAVVSAWLAQRQEAWIGSRNARPPSARAWPAAGFPPR